jgi:hypothetical protein
VYITTSYNLSVRLDACTTVLVGVHNSQLCRVDLFYAPTTRSDQDFVATTLPMYNRTHQYNSTQPSFQSKGRTIMGIYHIAIRTTGRLF